MLSLGLFFLMSESSQRNRQQDVGQIKRESLRDRETGRHERNGERVRDSDRVTDEENET